MSKESQSKPRMSERRADTSTFSSKSLTRCLRRQKKRHCQINSVYTSLEDFAAAERQQKSVYKAEDEETKDAWMLENGDTLCCSLKKYEKYEKKAGLQFAVYNDRRRLETYGLRDEYTI